MKNFSHLRVIGFVVAVALICFGTVDNLYRTLKFAWERLGKG